MKPQSERLGNEPIPRLLLDLAFPAMIGMLVMSFHNIIDTFFISRFVGTIGVGALSIALPVQMIIMALSGSFGIGGGSIISRRLGAKEVDKANLVLGNVLSVVIFISIAGIILGFKLLTPILYLFGSTETLLPYAQDYLGIILYGTAFFVFSMAMNNIIRSEGNAKAAMISMLISAVLNIILTPIFIAPLGMGVRGAALATVIAQGFTVIYLIVYFTSGKSSLHFKAINLRLKWPIIRETTAIGASFFVHQAAGSIMIIVANHMLIFYGGDLAISVFGIIYKILMFSIMPLMGIVQGLLPLVGYNYGANQHERVSESILLAIKVSVSLSLLAFIIIMAFPKAIILVFTDEAAAMKIGVTALRIMFSLSLTIGIQQITSGVFQALGRAKEAFILSVSRQIIFLIPLLLTLPFLFELTGVWMAFPLSDLLSFLLVIWFISKNRNIFFVGQPIVKGEV
ncbi:MAG TPA: MATE family efflux transporter [Firmicutes bacterium]|nr:MATE family efflux transporter [Bacillota bacterium]